MAHTLGSEGAGGGPTIEDTDGAPYYIDDILKAPSPPGTRSNPLTVSEPINPATHQGIARGRDGGDTEARSQASPSLNDKNRQTNLEAVIKQLKKEVELKNRTIGELSKEIKKSREEHKATEQLMARQIAKLERDLASANLHNGPVAASTPESSVMGQGAESTLREGIQQLASGLDSNGPAVQSFDIKVSQSFWGSQQVQVHSTVTYSAAPAGATGHLNGQDGVNAIGNQQSLSGSQYPGAGYPRPSTRSSTPRVGYKRPRVEDAEDE